MLLYRLFLRYATVFAFPTDTGMVELRDVETGEKVLRFLDALEDLDDTQDVYSNANIPEEAYN